MTEKTTRTEGDDEIIQLRVRRANLQSLIDGVTLGIDSLSRHPIVVRLDPVGDGTYALQAETNTLAASMTVPEPVDVEVIEPGDDEDRPEVN